MQPQNLPPAVSNDTDIDDNEKEDKKEEESDVKKLVMNKRGRTGDSTNTRYKNSKEKSLEVLTKMENFQGGPDVWMEENLRQQKKEAAKNDGSLEIPETLRNSRWESRLILKWTRAEVLALNAGKKDDQNDFGALSNMNKKELYCFLKMIGGKVRGSVVEMRARLKQFIHEGDSEFVHR